jgi:hypothetical protein
VDRACELDCLQSRIFGKFPSAQGMERATYRRSRCAETLRWRLGGIATLLPPNADL